MKSILDPSFRYRSSVHTDLKTTFAKIRRKQANKQQQHERVAQAVKLNANEVSNKAREVAFCRD